MKHKFIAGIRGNVEYPSMIALQQAFNAGVASIPNFSKTGSSIEVWQEDGKARDFSGNQRFTVALEGVVLADSYEDIDNIIAGFCTQYPEFVLTWQSVQGIQSAYGKLLDFNDDGTVYAPEPEVVEESQDSDSVVEEIIDPTAKTQEDVEEVSQE